ncbi:MAG: hypothetical protein KDJ65_33320 [Anaerolineae bacterium]|nr:hypothetical protein [Anaerolineae bacterium]
MSLDKNETPWEPSEDTEKQSKAQKFNSKKIRAVLREGFTDDELNRLCYDESDFKPFLDELGQDISKDRVIDKLIKYAERKELIAKLLPLIKKHNPNKYEKYEPYIEPTDNSAGQSINEKKAEPSFASVTEAPSYEKPQSTNEKKEEWKLIVKSIIISFVVLIAIFVLLVIMIPSIALQTNDLESKALPGAEAELPAFDITVLDHLGDDKMTYEITEHLRYDYNRQGVPIKWILQVIPEYKGDKSYGEVAVLVKDSEGDIINPDKTVKWTNFNKSSETLTITLDFDKIIRRVPQINLEGGFQTNIFETNTYTFPTKIFDIEVKARNNSTPLTHTQLVIQNSPWYHYAAVSAWKDDSVEVYVSTKNLGELSDFAVVAEIFKVDELPGKFHTTWQKVGSQQKVKTDVPREQEFPTTFTFPKDSNEIFTFEEDAWYVVHTYVVKKQNYIQFNDNKPWYSSERTWIMGSFSQDLLIKHP